MMSLLTVLIPVHNAAGTLNQALASLRSQTFDGWEAVLVDDASEDGSSELLESWVRRDGRFTLVRNEVQQGISASLNRAMENVQTPLIARMDADDICLSTRFERQVAAMRSNLADVVGCRVRYFTDGGDVGEGSLRYEEWMNSLTTPQEHERDLFVECPLAHPTLMMRRALLQAVGGYRSMGWPEDYDLLMRLSLQGASLAKVPERLLLWRDHAARLSRTHSDYWISSFFRLKAHFLCRRYLAQGRPPLIFGAGPVGKALVRCLLEEGCRPRGFVDLDPKKQGQSLHGLPVYGLSDALALRGEVFGLGALGQPGARQNLRTALAHYGWSELDDFCCVA